MTKIHEQITPETWGKGASVMYSNGMPCYNDTDPNAARWCALGWARKVYADDGTNKLNSIYNKMDTYLESKTYPGDYVSRWNDAPERTFEEVKEMFTVLDI